MEPEFDDRLRCPNCGEPATFHDHGSYATEPHGELHFDEWLTCSECGAVTDWLEVTAHNTPLADVPANPFTAGSGTIQ